MDLDRNWHGHDETHRGFERSHVRSEDDEVESPSARARARRASLAEIDRMYPLAAIQRRSVGAVSSQDSEVSRVAQQGVSGTAGALPHGAEIQRRFGRHDISHVEAFVDSPAAESAHALNAEAYATGDKIGFARAPDGSRNRSRRRLKVADQAAHSAAR